jgi:hypothetical protein
MRARDVVGRRIVAIEQETVWHEGIRFENMVRIILDNGRRIFFTVGELDGDYAVEGHVTRPQPKGCRCDNGTPYADSHCRIHGTEANA